MCGIVGAVNHSGKYVSGMENTMRQLLWADTLRGGDATGIYCLNKDLKVLWAKQCVDGWTFCATNDTGKDILRKSEEHPFIIGHNRAATQGAHDKIEFAHPVVIPKKIGLVHNGTLTAWPQRNLSDPKKRIDHDSTAIAQIIASEGLQAFLQQCWGAWSLAWHDVQKDTLQLYRNEDRPMAVVHTENVVFYGSELGLLMWVIQRNGFKPLRHYYTKPQHLYTFEIGEPEPKVERVEKKFMTYSTPMHGGRFPVERAKWLTDEEGADSRDDESGHAVGGSSSAGYDGYQSANLRRRREAARLAEELLRRDNLVEQEAASKAQGTGGTGAGNDSTKQSNVRDIRGKDHGKVIQSWKTFHKGSACMFSIFDYGEIKDNGNGPMYNIQADASVAIDFPEVQIRGVVKVSELPQHVLQDSENYFIGDISTIIATDNGNIVIWVRNVQETTTKDPGCKTRLTPRDDTPYFKKRLNELFEDKAGELFTADEQAEVTVTPSGIVIPGTDSVEKGVLLTKRVDIRGKEFCQHCSSLTDKGKLRFVTETSDGADGKSTIHQLRLCEDCVVEYAENRDAVVPANMRGHLPRQTEVRKF